MIYEPLPDGRLRLIGADYPGVRQRLGRAAPGRDATAHGPAAASLRGARIASACRPFYTLHVWAWKDNPTGTFVNWHANVSCDNFSGQ